MHFHFQFLPRIFHRLDISYEPDDFGIEHDTLGGLSTLFHIHRSLANVFIEVRQLLVQLANLQSEAEQFRFLERTTRGLRGAESQGGKAGSQIML
jgi:hypothetical protein